MREGLLMIPQADNAGHSLKSLRDKTALKLTQSFGGVTIREAQGLWADKSGALYGGPIWEIATAYEPSPDNDATLCNLADLVGREGNQLAVYVRYASGNVEVRDTSARQLAV